MLGRCDKLGPLYDNVSVNLTMSKLVLYVFAIIKDSKKKYCSLVSFLNG
jgi:hypothetical protein